MSETIKSRVTETPEQRRERILRNLTQVRDVFCHAHSLLERGWCQNVLARAGGKEVDFTSEKATNFCVSGAVNRVAWEMIGKPDAPFDAHYTSLVGDALYRLHMLTNEKHRGTTGVVMLNDTANKKTVLRLLEEAVQRTMEEMRKVERDGAE